MKTNPNNTKVFETTGWDSKSKTETVYEDHAHVLIQSDQKCTKTTYMYAYSPVDHVHFLYSPAPLGLSPGGYNINNITINNNNNVNSNNNNDNIITIRI